MIRLKLVLALAPAAVVASMFTSAEASVGWYRHNMGWFDRSAFDGNDGAAFAWSRASRVYVCIGGPHFVPADPWAARAPRLDGAWSRRQPGRCSPRHQSPGRWSPSSGHPGRLARSAVDPVELQPEKLSGPATGRQAPGQRLPVSLRLFFSFCISAMYQVVQVCRLHWSQKNTL
jgi:hypothetical protein